MPTYEYKCTACKHHFEQFQSMRDKPLKACPSCGKQKLERLIGTGAAVIFKGSGFYQTDYRSESYKKAADADAKSAAPAPPAATNSAAKPAESATSTPAPAAPASPDSSPTRRTSRPSSGTSGKASKKRARK